MRRKKRTKKTREKTEWKEIWAIFGGKRIAASVAVSAAITLCISFIWWDHLQVTRALELAITPLALVVSTTVFVLALVATLAKDVPPNSPDQTSLIGAAVIFFLAGMMTIGLILVHVALGNRPNAEGVGSMAVGFVLLVLSGSISLLWHLLGYVTGILRARPDGGVQEGE